MITSELFLFSLKLFTLSDAWVVKFENAVVFNSEWKHDLHVYDLNDETDSLVWIAEIEIGTWGTELPQNVDITITSPEPFTTLTTSDLQVAWTTVKNHRVIVKANGNEFETISNDDGIFELTVPNQSPNFGYRVELVSEPGLQKVELEINDSISLLTETDSWTYVWDFIAPNDLWQHAISAILQNSLGVKSTYLNTASINVIAPEPEPELESAPVEEKKEEVKPVVIEPVEIPNLTITWLKLTKLKTKSILEWDSLEDADSYNVYIKEWGDLLFVETVIEPRSTIYITGDKITYNDFIIRAVKEAFEDNKDIEWDLSDAVTIQTGPERYILLLFITLLISTFIFSWKSILKK